MTRQDIDQGDPITAGELRALLDVERLARGYAAFTHANLGRPVQYRAREEARDKLLDALAHLDRIRQKAA